MGLSPWGQAVVAALLAYPFSFLNFLSTYSKVTGFYFDDMTRTRAEDYTVGWVCGIAIERVMAREMLDEEYTKDKEPWINTSQDYNSYTFGRVGEHNVVIASLPQGRYGITSATIVATHMQSSFSALQVRLMVGIAGGAPSEEHDIRLGDVVVSSPTPGYGGILQYDYGKAIQNHEFQISSHMASPPEHLLNAMMRLKAQHKADGHRITERVAQILGKKARLTEDCSRPRASRDRLYQADYAHLEKECHCCKDDDHEVEAHSTQHHFLVLRSERKQDDPAIHYGLVASANSLMKDATTRDKLIKKHNVLCFEMEAAGLMNSFPCVTIRGICDYSDTHKNDEWQGYAAATAAAYAKELLEIIPARRGVQSNIFEVPFSLEGVPIPKKFIDRPLEMGMLTEVLLPTPETSQRKVFVLRGLGGIGKTQLAVQFLRTHHSKFSAAFWLDGSSEDSLKLGIANIASKISPDQISDASTAYARATKGDINTVVSEVLTWFAKASNNRWLLIFDNVDRDSNSSKPDPLAYDIMRFVPSTDHGSVLVTTRLMRLEHLGESMEVKKVDQGTARKILESWYKKATNDKDGVVRLLEYLDGLPLAIAQAGAYLQESGMNLNTYLQMYEEQRGEIAEMLHGSDILLRDYPGRSVWTTWIISYNAVLARNKYAAHLLLLWSFLGNGDLWYGMFDEAIKRRISIVQALSKWLGSITNEPRSFFKAMTLLRRYSLVEASGSSDGYIMHAVVHRWAYFYQGLQRQSDIGMLALALIGAAVPKDIERDYARLQQRLLPHAQVCCVRALNQQAGVSKSADRDNVSAPITDQEQQENILEAIHNLGMLYLDQGKLDEAEKIYLQALQGKEEALGAKHTSTLDTIHSLGILYRNQSKLDEAKKMYARALQGKEEVLGAKHISTLQTVDHLGFIYWRQDELDKAEDMHMRALQGFEEALGPKHTSTLGTINNLGLLYAGQDKLDEAERMHMRALNGFEEALGPKHTTTLFTVEHLGWLYRKQGKLDEAEKMHVRALQGREEALGSKHILTLFAANNLGLIYTSQGKPEAEKMYLRALQGKTEVFGANHKSTLETVKNLGSLYYKQGKLSKAEEMLLRALQGYEDALDAELVKTYTPALNTLEYLGDLYSKTRPDKSLAMYAKALSGYTIVCGGSSDICLDIKRRLDALDISSRESAANPEPGVNLTKDDNEPSGRERKVKKLIRIFEK